MGIQHQPVPTFAEPVALAAGGTPGLGGSAARASSMLLFALLQAQIASFWEIQGYLVHPQRINTSLEPGTCPETSWEVFGDETC